MRDSVHPSLVVELAGVPGAGKSSLAGVLRCRLRTQHRPLTVGTSSTAPAVPRWARLARKGAMLGRNALADPALAAKVGRGLAAAGGGAPVDVLARAVQWHVSQDLLRAAASRPGTTLLDEGVVQALWSIGLRADVQPVLTALAVRRTWRAPDVLVVLRVPPSVAAERLRTRAARHSRSQSLGAVALASELAHGAALLDDLLDWWWNMVGLRCQVLDVDTGGAIDDVAGSLVPQVEHALTKALGNH